MVLIWGYQGAFFARTISFCGVSLNRPCLSFQGFLPRLSKHSFYQTLALLSQILPKHSLSLEDQPSFTFSMRRSQKEMLSFLQLPECSPWFGANSPPPSDYVDTFSPPLCLSLPHPTFDFKHTSKLCALGAHSR